MKKSTILISAAALLTLSVTPLLQADENTHRQEVEKLFKLTQMEDKINESVDSVMQLQLRQNPQLVQYKDQMYSFFAKYIGWDALKNDLTDMYMQTFTEDELKSMNEFYISPVGQKVLNSLPELVAQRNQLAMSRMQQNIGELQKLISQAQNPPAQ